MELYWRYCVQYFKSFLSNGWACIGTAIVLLILGFLSAGNRKSSAGLWTFIIIAAILIMIGLGDITGLGFGMSF